MSAPAPDEKACELLASVQPIVAGKPHLKEFLTPSTLARYLRARNMNVSKASKMLTDTLNWRETEQIHELKWDSISEHARTGKVMRLPVETVDGRPALHLRPRMENNTKDQAGNIRHMTYQMEMASKYADKVSPDGKLLWIIDYTDFSLATSPPLKTALATLRILQNHYPERLHEAILWHPPSIFNLVWKGISPFIDAETSKKLVFMTKKDPEAVQKLNSRLDVTVLDKALGGTVDDTFSFEKTAALLQAEEAAHDAAFQAFLEMEIRN